jgi:nucleotide-binding universal stress UspA family protein
MKLLLPIDVSEGSLAAVETVLHQFSPKDTVVRLFHVVDWEQQLPAPYFFIEGRDSAGTVLAERDRIMRDAQAQMRDVETRLKAAGFAADLQVVADTSAANAIVDAARAWEADLIVMGSHGWSGLHRLLLGSVAEAVMRHAHCSVQVVRPSEVGAHESLQPH